MKYRDLLLSSLIILVLPIEVSAQSGEILTWDSFSTFGFYAMVASLVGGIHILLVKLYKKSRAIGIMNKGDIIPEGPAKSLFNILKKVNFDLLINVHVFFMSIAVVLGSLHGFYYLQRIPLATVIAGIFLLIILLLMGLSGIIIWLQQTFEKAKKVIPSSVIELATSIHYPTILSILFYTSLSIHYGIRNQWF